jgi:hypothetical protein
VKGVEGASSIRMRNIKQNPDLAGSVVELQEEAHGEVVAAVLLHHLRRRI